MKYILEAMGKVNKGDVNYKDIEIPVEVNMDDDYKDGSIVFSVPDWWVPIKELEHLLAIAKGLTREEEE